jgi:hypothetical protein
MSFERKCLIELGDVIALHFHCKKCGAETVLRMGKLAASNWGVLVTSACMYCQTPSGIQPYTAEGNAFMNFIEALQKVIEAANGRNLALKLEIACPEH